MMCVLLSAHAAADRAPISIDGLFDDWAEVPVVGTDPAGDANPSLDLRSLRVADDDRFLFLRIETEQDIDLSEQNALRIYIDTDNNPATGLPAGDIGAELEWRPGQRTGLFHRVSSPVALSQSDLRFRGAPTVTAPVFEIAIALDATPDGATPLFPGDQIRIRLEDPASGDTLPDADGSIPYTLGFGDAPPVEPRSFDRVNPADLRVTTHNTLRDNIFAPFFQPAFERLYTAVDPDILHLQEIYDASAGQTRDLIASWLGGTWHAAEVSDCITVSRFPILGSWPIGGNLAVLLDTTPAIGTPMLAVNAHLFCCGNDSGRQQEVDAIIAFIREAYAPGGDLSLTPDVPVMITGDLNLVGEARQLETLLTGDIANELAFGPDYAPDPDGTPLTNIISRQTEKRMGYTWRSDSSSFWPGQLDFLIYSDSNLTRRHDFIVYTPEMSEAELQANGLLAGDSTASDHLVFTADFAPVCPADLNGDGLLDLSDLNAFVAAFTNQQPPADLAPPAGVYDLADLNAFVAFFVAGCPGNG
jgi:endonuclease/exonuclease/phosphatase family metal-dependent hydrolase